jgi:hypothetical protein
MTPPRALGPTYTLPGHLRRASATALNTLYAPAATAALPPTAQQLLSGHQQLIAQNPIAITFERETRARKGAGFEAWKADPVGGLGPYTCRVFQQSRGSSQQSAETTGSQERDATWGILMPGDVPLRSTDGEDGNVRVHVNHPVFGAFRLRRVRPLESSGVVWGWQGDLERISFQGPVPPGTDKPEPKKGTS